jgi:hypothetical protein
MPQVSSEVHLKKDHEDETNVMNDQDSILQEVASAGETKRTN